MYVCVHFLFTVCGAIAAQRATSTMRARNTARICFLVFCEPVNFSFPQAFAQNAKSAAGKSGSKQPRGRSKAAALAEMDVDTMFKQEDLNKIRQLLDRVMLRRLKEQAIALPRKVFHDIWLPISDLSAKWYRRLLEIKSLQEEARSNSARVNFRKMLGLVIKMRILW